ncbi:MAG: SPOR domain-containing protein [Trueperaceae bacterium]
MPGLAQLPRRLPVALLALWALVSAQAISYTVQIVAVSDQESALSVQRTLLNDAFPAYVVRATTVQGDIYRVRVGAFGNRAAALVFAQAMSIVAGGPPLPALAEGIPAGVMPLEPRVLVQFSGGELDVLPWGDRVALRNQENAASPATYRILGDEEPWVFEAWSAAPVEGGVLRLRSMALWPSTWEDDAPEAREAYRLALLESVASRLGLSSADIEPLQGRPVYGPPFLVILELVASGGESELATLGVAQPGESGEGPGMLAVGTGLLPQAPEPLYRASAESRPEDEEFNGEEWSVEPAGDFFLLSFDESGRGWRAGVGVPLWSDAHYLLTRAEEMILFYDFVPR